MRHCISEGQFFAFTIITVAIPAIRNEIFIICRGFHWLKKCLRTEINKNPLMLTIVNFNMGEKTENLKRNTKRPLVEIQIFSYVDKLPDNRIKWWFIFFVNAQLIKHV